MVEFMKWALTDGQKFAAELGYAPLPARHRRHGADRAPEGEGLRPVRIRPSAPDLTKDHSAWDGHIRARADSDCRRIGVEFTRQSMLSIRSSAALLADPNVGSGRRQFWCAHVYRGTLYSSVLVLLLSTPIAVGIAVFVSELSPSTSPRSRSMFVTELLAAIPSIVYGLWGIFVLVPFVRLEVATPERSQCLSSTVRRWRRHALGRADSCDHGHPVYLVGRARGAEVGAPVTARRRVALGATRFEAIRTALFYAARASSAR